MAGCIDRDGAAEHAEPSPHDGDPGEDGGQNHEHACIKVVIETARDDQVVGHERERPGEAEDREAEEQEERRQGGGIRESPLERLDRDHAAAALERPDDEAHAGQR